MGLTVGVLGPVPTTAAEGSAAEDGLGIEDGPAAATSAAGDPTIVEEGPAAGGEGPWHTRGRKVWALLVFSIYES